jgi:hypothetical protein
MYQYDHGTFVSLSEAPQLDVNDLVEQAALLMLEEGEVLQTFFELRAAVARERGAIGNLLIMKNAPKPQAAQPSQPCPGQQQASVLSAEELAAWISTMEQLQKENEELEVGNGLLGPLEVL